MPYLPSQPDCSKEIIFHTYILLLRAETAFRPNHAAMEKHTFPKGWYTYQGSAQRGLEQRVARHFKREKPSRWHVDGVTTHPMVRPIGAVALGGVWSECKATMEMGGRWGLVAPVRGFGASDCRHGCPAHLFQSDQPITLEELSVSLGGEGALILPSEAVE